MTERNNRGFRGAFDTYPLTKAVILFGLLVGSFTAFVNPEAGAVVGSLVLTAVIILGIFLKV